MPSMCSRITPFEVSGRGVGPPSRGIMQADTVTPMGADWRNAMARNEAFVVSDLHLGAGDFEPELEDFDQDEKLAAFLDQIARPGVTFFINGDFIDFAQIPPYDVPEPHHLLWTETASLTKVRLATNAHPLVFSALAEFLKKGGVLHMLV